MDRPVTKIHYRYTYLTIPVTLCFIALIYFGQSSTRAQISQDRVFQQRTIDPYEYYVSEQEGVAKPSTALHTRFPQSGQINIVAELTDDPAAKTFAAVRLTQSRISAIRATQQHVNRIERAQVQLLPALFAMKAEVIYRTQRVYNGIAMRVDADKLDQIRLLPGVKAIHPLTPKNLMTSTSVPFIGAPQVWKGNNLNLTGKGIKIGIIDTGIDYKHADFGGNSSTTFPSAKVVGGFDFVGDAYDGTNTPVPDNDPMDCNGHGTHVAGIAAGVGVSADGTTYSGPYDQSVPFSTMKIGPGVAPEAQLYALRVFGCSGSTLVADKAIEWAMDPNGDGDFSDHLDVINLSLGSDYGTTDDPTAIAADNAAQAGVIVVAASGNAGDSYYITSSPAVASRAISVAASIDDGTTTPAIKINNPRDITGLYDDVPALLGPTLTESGLTGDVVYAQPNNGCGPLTNSATVAGKIVLIESDTCPFLDKARNAQAAGALALVVTRSFPGIILVMGPPDSSITIPCVMIAQSTGTLIKSSLSNGNVNVSLASTLGISHPELSDLIATFTSRGVRLGDSMMKPDLTAPGVSITSAKSGSGNGSIKLSGTSMATPHVAGEMALLRQLHPEWTVNELKALAIDTAIDDVVNVHTNPPGLQRYSPSRVGAGRIDLPDAATDSVIAFDPDNPDLVSLSFGAPEVANTLTLTKTIRLLNKGSSPVTYSVTYDNVVDMAGVDISLPDGPSVTIPAGGTANIHVQMLADASLFTDQHDRFLDTQQTLNRFYFAEESGYIAFMLAGSNSPSVRVPLYAAPKGVWEINPTAKTIFFFNGPVMDLEFTRNNSGVGMDAVFELLAHLSPSDSAVGLSKSADVEYLGISNNYSGSGPLGSSKLSFGFATYQNWSTPNEIKLEVGVDTDRDGIDDFLIYNSNVNDLSQGQDIDDFQTQVYNVKQAKVVAQNYPNGVQPVLSNRVFNTNLIYFPLSVTDLGLTDSNSGFNFTVRCFYRGVLVKKTQTFSYDAAKPGLSFEFSGITVFNHSSILPFIPITFFPDNYHSLGSQGILTLGFDNLQSTHASIISVSTDNPVPVINSLDESNPIVAGQNNTLFVRGRFFAPAATGQWNGRNKSIVFDDTSTIRISLFPSDVPTAGSGIVTVTNPAPGGGISNQVIVTVINPAPFINGVSPVSIQPVPGTTFNVTGLRFVPTSAVNLNGKPLSTTFVDSTTLTATFSQSDIIDAGDAKVTVVNSAPGGGTSNEKVVTITKGVASLSLDNLDQIYDGTPKRASVFSSPTGISGITVTYNGITDEPVNAGTYNVIATLNNNAFLPTSVTGTLTIAKADQSVSFSPVSDKFTNDAPFKIDVIASSGLPVTFQTSNNISITGSTVTILGTGTAIITASQPGDSNHNAALPVSRSFNINNPFPQILRLNPGAIVAGGSQATVKIFGGNFVAGSLVRIDGVLHSAAFVNTTELDLQLSPAEIASAATKNVTVVNPQPGGGTVSASLKIISIISSDTKTVPAGGNDTASNAPSAAGDAGIRAQLNHSQSSNGSATVTVSTYSADPLGNSGLIDVGGGGYVDLKVTGASASDSLNATFYYSSTVTGANETKLRLLYFNGTQWAAVKSSGNTDPLKNTTDNQDVTISGGTFTVAFDETSSPKLSELSGTIFSSSPGLYGDLNGDLQITVSDLVLLANAIAGNLTIDTQAGDLNQDGVVTISDLVTLANFLAGNIGHLPVSNSTTNSSSSPAASDNIAGLFALNKDSRFFTFMRLD